MAKTHDRSSSDSEIPKESQPIEKLEQLESPKGRECWVYFNSGGYPAVCISRAPTGSERFNRSWVHMREVLPVPAVAPCAHDWQFCKTDHAEYHLCLKCWGIGRPGTGEILMYVPELQRIPVPAVEALPEPTKESRSIGPHCGECGEWCESCQNGKNRIDGGVAPLGSQGGEAPDWKALCMDELMRRKKLGRMLENAQAEIFQLKKQIGAPEGTQGEAGAATGCSECQRMWGRHYATCSKFKEWKATEGEAGKP